MLKPTGVYDNASKNASSVNLFRSCRIDSEPHSSCFHRGLVAFVFVAKLVFDSTVYGIYFTEFCEKFLPASSPHLRP